MLIYIYLQHVYFTTYYFYKNFTNFFLQLQQIDYVQQFQEFEFGDAGLIYDIKETTYKAYITSTTKIFKLL